MDLRRLLFPAAALLALAPLAHAATPAPLDAVRFSFPGSVLAPSSAVSAGMLFADRYAGDDVTQNPAARITRGVVVSPQLARVSRQDLSANNREFDQRFASIDFAGASLSIPVRAVDVTLYAWQPAFRAENTSYTVGTKNQLSAPARITTDATERELRAGLALGFGRGATRVGIAAEFTHRDDDFQTLEVSGSPQSGTREASYSGDAFGGGIGVRWERHPELAHGLVLGAALHFTGALDATGSSVSTLLSDTTTLAVNASRDGVWQAGASARWSLSPLSGLYATFGARGPEKWSDFAVQTKLGTDGAIGIDYRDPELPWAARAGVGLEVQPGAPEPRAGGLGLGMTWYSGDTTFDLALTHRTLTRPGAPNSADERLVGSVRVKF